MHLGDYRERGLRVWFGVPGVLSCFVGLCGCSPWRDFVGLLV